MNEITASKIKVFTWWSNNIVEAFGCLLYRLLSSIFPLLFRLRDHFDHFDHFGKGRKGDSDRTKTPLANLRIDSWQPKSLHQC